ncbi:RecE-linked protein [Bacillus phage 0105phi7-2]|uniref:RecE-linked protein n=1 Tax=Bacillus phage 0105phi7-2 TaxID=3025408 RepID=A0AAF0BTJ6_9CAUD|nr:RecE-linked protein [Bacillus phage 0105phi7-2]WCS66597.1 RecE-linked protein [Bacillus phage 0105phi7-2]
MNGLTNIDYSEYMPKPEAKSTATEAMVSRQAQEVQMAMYVAKNFPRDTYDAFQRIMKECERKLVAENAVYQYPKGGQKVQGPSIRLAEVIARNWGNIDYGIIELDQKDGESSMMAYAWDLETNTRQTKIFTVKHERKAKGKTNKLTDSRDVYELTANMGTRRMRACILGIIPGDIVDAAVQKCNDTLINGQKEPLEDRLRKALDAFKKDFGVTKEMIEDSFQLNIDAFTEHDFVKLGRTYTSIREGVGKKEDFFDTKKTSPVKSNLEAQFQQTEGVNDEPSPTK